MAVGFDADSGQLTVCPESSAWATKAHLEQVRIVAAAHKAARRQVVSALRILPPGAVSMLDCADVSPEPAAPAVPVERRPPAGRVPPRARRASGGRRSARGHRRHPRRPAHRPHL
ncbi:hypothetical protein [Streptomyces sp. NPDC047097]|uniref:hypothetical protein n=1 Tax=Streptomyces sp. NPDC047097 TaxID=3155260 RepID=UPI0033D40ECB